MYAGRVNMSLRRHRFALRFRLPLGNPVVILPLHLRNGGKIVHRRRRRNAPLQRGRVPGIVARRRAFLEAAEKVVHENEQADDDDEHPNGRQHIHQLPPETGAVSVNPARHPVEAGVVHRKEGQVHPHEHRPEVNLAHQLVVHPARDLGIPVVNPGENAKDSPAEQHIVNVRHYVVGILLLEIGRGHRVRYPGQPADNKQRHKTDGHQHRRFQVNGTVPHRADPVENLHPRGNCNQHRGNGEHRVRNGAKPHREHMVAPHRPAHDGNDNARENHHRVPEQRLPAECRYDFRNNAHRRQNQNVHLRVPEQPEQVLPQDGIAPGGRVEKVGVKLPVGRQLNQRHRDDRERQHQQDAGHQRHPHEHRHPHQRHPRRPHIDDGNHKIETRRQRRHAQHL